MDSVPADLLPEDHPVEGAFRLPPRVEGMPFIQFRPVQEPPLPVCDARFHDHDSGKHSGLVLLPDRLVADLRRNLPLRHDIEEGGYLLGHVCRQPGSPEAETAANFRWLVEVTELVMAEETRATALQLLFTGDSWSKVSRRRDRDHPHRRLVGWFHTHLFPADERFGLSRDDQQMHAWYLPRPWQIALLLNLEHDGSRHVRCYQRGPGGVLVQTPFEVIGESRG